VINVEDASFVGGLRKLSERAGVKHYPLITRIGVDKYGASCAVSVMFNSHNSLGTIHKKQLE